MKKKSFTFSVTAKKTGPPAIEGSLYSLPAFGGSKKFRTVNVTVKSHFKSWAKRKAISIAKEKLPKKDGWYGHYIGI